MRTNIAAIGLVLLCLFVVAPNASAVGAQGLMPPNAKYRGKSLEEWAVLSMQWQIATTLGDPSGLSDNVKGVQFLPPAVGGGEFAYNVTLAPGTPFVQNSFFIFGERYSDGTQDNPSDPIIPFIFETTTIKTILDGKVILAGKTSDMDDRLVGPVSFPAPIVYNEPQPRGPGLDAIAATFLVGISGLVQPLSVGQHTLESTTDSEVFGATHVTYNISVVPGGQIHAVPEPSSIALVSIVLVGLVAIVRRRAAA